MSTNKENSLRNGKRNQTRHILVLNEKYVYLNQDISINLLRCSQHPGGNIGDLICIFNDQCDVYLPPV